ncbi:hypothetical protein ACFOMD_01670 [Sphingoaurantiacus capsulatus]|uniref:Uncharacterized protein n=1 Tax=Sphingoaurantiacus capsulatus TaxID=1771310 RepID=A0ABV7X583_9SPHN
MLTLLVLAVIGAGLPFPLEPQGNRDLVRLRDAWVSSATSVVERGEMDARIRAAATHPTADWRAVADDYFVWREARRAAADGRLAAAYARAREHAREQARRPTCTTVTRTEPRPYGRTYSESTTTCDK